jgi:hypothetical protein
MLPLHHLLWHLTLASADCRCNQHLAAYDSMQRTSVSCGLTLAVVTLRQAVIRSAAMVQESVVLVVHPQQLALYSRTAAGCAAAWSPHPGARLAAPHELLSGCLCMLTDHIVSRMSACPAKLLQSGNWPLDVAGVHTESPDHCALLVADSTISGTAIAAAAFGHDGALVYAAMHRSAVIAVFAGDTLQPVARVAAPGLSAALSSSRFTDIAAGGVLRGGGTTLLLATSGGKVHKHGRGRLHLLYSITVGTTQETATANLCGVSKGGTCWHCASIITHSAAALLPDRDESSCVAQVIEVTADAQQLLGGSGTPRIKDEAAAQRDPAAAAHHQGTPDTT